mmetsp:Transcript_17517/g.66243  ORF Transcript_17517/g.66243 Transcript_17517/m.66243 type:complete len:115 (-) Transcript_17517:252-596(-)
MTSKQGAGAAMVVAARKAALRWSVCCFGHSPAPSSGNGADALAAPVASFDAHEGECAASLGQRGRPPGSWQAARRETAQVMQVWRTTDSGQLQQLPDNNRSTVESCNNPAGSHG